MTFLQFLFGGNLFSEILSNYTTQQVQLIITQHRYMNLSFYIDKAIKKIKYDSFFKRSRMQKKELVSLNIPEIKHPIYLRTNTSDVEVFYQIFYYKGYNVDFKFEPKVIFDLGANIGLASVYYKNKYPNATIIAVEPETSNFEMLKKNTEKYDNIHCLQSGIWNKTTNLKITNSGQHWAFVTEEVDFEDDTTVKAISIDELMKKYNVDYIDILKVDIESSEKELFEANYEKWLPKVRVLLVELHDHMKEGCTRSFFKAVVNHKFTMACKGENVIIEML